jgi:hypothetical protein
MDPALLEAALEGLQHRLDDVNEKIEEVRRSLGGMQRRAAPAAAGTSTAPRKRRRTMSAAARKKIAEAQRRRWAAFHAQSRKPGRKAAAAKAAHAGQGA